MWYNIFMKKYLVISMLVLGLFVQPFFAFAASNSAQIDQLNQQIAQSKDKVAQLQATIDKYNQNIQQKELQSVSLKNQLSILDNHIGKAQSDIDVTQEKIKQAQLQIDALNLSIQDKEKIIEKQKGIIAQMVININADKQKNFLEILLTNNSFSQFYDELQRTTNVYVDLGKSVKVLRLAKEDLQKQQQQVESEKKTYEDLKQQLEDNQAALVEQSNAKQQLLVATHSSELKYKTLLSSLKQQYQQTQNEINSFEQQMRKQLDQQDKLSVSVGQLAWPVPSRTINALFHDPDYPFKNVMQHSGVDIKASQGTPVHAAAAGYVAQAKTCTTASCYAYVLIIHTESLSTLYGHLSRIIVVRDQFVAQGDIIGYSGGTPGAVGSGPFVTGPHLHFETRLNGIPVDPLNYLQGG